MAGDRITIMIGVKNGADSLVVDDERNMRWVLDQALRKAGYEVLTAENGVEALQKFALNSVDLVMLDLKMPGMDGLSLLRELRQRNTQVPILLLTAYASVPTAVEAIQIGANDYLRKPFDIETMLGKVHEHIALAQIEQLSEPAHTESKIGGGFADGFDQFIGSSLALVRPLDQAAVAAKRTSPVSIIGERGTGRRHLARLLHQETAASKEGRLLLIDCDATPETLLATDLHQESGGWHQALGGSLILANVDQLSAHFVQKLCDFLIGYLHTPQRPHGVRLLLTAHSPLAESWTLLFDQLLSIHLPPLRQRMGDLRPLLTYLLPEAIWTAEAQATLATYTWPGNIAELQRVARQAVYLAGDQTIQTCHLPSELVKRSDHPVDNSVSDKAILPPEGINLETLEKNLIQQAVVVAQGNKSQMARLLGLTRATLLYRLEKYGIVG